ncbi:MAG: alpha-L-fucosidase [Eudoraea sp.]|nr:alpha-L-fucosidase [Eudoraea sp.]
MISTSFFKTTIVLLLLLVLGSTTQAQPQPAQEYLDQYNNKMTRTKWFRDARFGMFIHFGPYAVAARGEWVKSNEKMTTSAYQKYVDAFVPSNYDAVNWASIAKQAGMKYAVMTAKHHDGFCMFNSEQTDYKITSNLPGRDFIKEYTEAFRAEGLKVGLYYSLIDWHHKDYPHVGNHPLRDGNTRKKNVNWDNYVTYMHKQVEELMTQYGKIDVLWLDYSFDDYEGEKWKAKELVAMIRKHQPAIIINSRLEVNQGNSEKGRLFNGYGDFETPEQAIPDKGLVNIYNQPIPWETCLTLNNNWGYAANDNEWKSPETIVHALVEVVSKNGNLLLNVGPDSQGNIPFPSKTILSAVGRWMKQNNESIYGCGSSDLTKPNWGYFTQKGATLFAHWTYPKIGYINIKGIGDTIDKVTFLHNGKKAPTANTWWGNEDQDNFFINVKTPIYHTFELPDKTDTVFKISLKH